MGPAEWAAISAASIALVGAVAGIFSTWRLQQQLRRDQARYRAISSGDAERREKRAQAVGVFTWAAELAVSRDQDQARVGIKSLQALLDGDLLDEDVKILVETALNTALTRPVREVQAAIAADEQIRVRELGFATEGRLGVPSETGEAPIAVQEGPHD